MSVDVIGAGYFRTGTSSFREAMKILGFGPCYHMSENIQKGDCDSWISISESRDPTLVKSLLEKRGYRSTADFPSMVFWREQMVAFPNAKVILTVRDADKWFKSATSTVFYMNPSFSQCPLGVRVVWGLEIRVKSLPKFFRKVWDEYLFPGQTSKESIIKAFHAHNETVKREVLPEKLLVFDVSEGWEPLCKFLNVPIPEVPFPNINDTKHFQALGRKLNTIGYIYTILGLGIPLFFRAKSYSVTKKSDYEVPPLGIDHALLLKFIGALSVAIGMGVSLARYTRK